MLILQVISLIKYFTQKYICVHLEHLLQTKTDLGHHFALLGKVCHGLQHPVRIEQGQHII